MWVSNQEGKKYLSTFHAECVALSQSLRNLVPMETVVSEVVIVAGFYTKRQEFSTQTTVFEDNYEVVRVNSNHKFPVITPLSKHVVVKYHWFREKIDIGGCSMKMMYRKYQNSNIFTKDPQGDILLHIINSLYVWQRKEDVHQIVMVDKRGITGKALLAHYLRFYQP